MEAVFNVLPKRIEEQIRLFPPESQEFIEEIRVRVMRPLEIIIKGKPYFSDYIVDYEESIQLLNHLSQYSIYTLEEELKRGYITIQGGHRIGLAGKVITENSRVKAIKNVTSFNIRIARQKLGAASHLIPHLYTKKWLNTIIIGPPQSGKTTLLRDLARIISSGEPKKCIPSAKVGVVDERSEITGCVKGVPQHEFGHRLDVLDACPKAEGMMMLIRSMSPDVLIADEIGREEDVESIMEAVYAGVSMIVTVHGYGYEDIRKRPSLKPLWISGVFDRYIEIDPRKGLGVLGSVRDHNGIDLLPKVRVTS